ncbi:hypothetical protein GCM10023149_27140 [Mucilaginibacter gynuensis]|uniref:Uncharacterized protein n=1 Tax=Mucilaginibacter gynuensis TaxID=1302236 RepID=A0ABP8GIJ4_9SPHI
MKALRILLILVVLSLSVVTTQKAVAQCAACTAAVETNNASGDTKTSGLNSGIMYLLAMPYIAVAIVGFVWYKKYRRKNVTIQMRSTEKLHLN